MPSASVVQTVSGIGTVVQASQPLTAGASQDVTEPIPDASVDLPVVYALDSVGGNLVMLAILTTVAMTIKTNSSGAPVDTVVTVANVMVLYTGAPTVNPFGSGDVTSLFVSNASGSSGTLNIRSLSDPTP